MSYREIGLLLLLGSLATGCSKVIKPDYTSTNPDIMRVGGDTPSNPQPVIENVGSFCVEISDNWHRDGKTPDGQALWAKDTARKVVPCK